MVEKIKKPLNICISEIINKYKLFIFDCDGVLYLEGILFPETSPLLKTLKKENKNFIFLTNNNTHSRKKLLERFQVDKTLEPIVNEDIIYSSGYILSLYLKNYCQNVKKSFVIGTNELAEEFSKVGIKTVSSKESEHINDLGLKSNDKFFYDNACIPDEDFDSVIVGFDKNLNYFNISYALRILSRNNTRLFGTNIDKNVQVRNGLLPGTGTFVSCIESCSERKAEIISKPNPFCIEILIDNMNKTMQKSDPNFQKIEKKDILMIGDNLYTDIKFANNSGIDSAIVLTGVTKIENIEELVELKSKNINSKIEINNNVSESSKYRDLESVDEFGLPTYVFNNLKI